MQEDQSTSNIKEKAKDQIEEQTETVRSYAQRHPLRMYTTALAVGFGAGLWTKSRNQKSGFQKFMDQIRD